MRDPADRLIWLLAWDLIERVQRGVINTRVDEFVDPVDGRSLRLSHGDHPCELVLNQRLGVSLLAPIAFENVPWHRVASRPLDQFAALLRDSLAWSSRRDADQVSGAALARAVLSRILSFLWSDDHEWWIGSLVAEAVDSWQSSLGAEFPTLLDQLAARWEVAVVAGYGTPVPEVWVLYRDHEPLAAFDDSAGIHMHESRWSYADVHEEVGRDTTATAFYCVQSIRAIN